MHFAYCTQCNAYFALCARRKQKCGISVPHGFLGSSPYKFTKIRPSNQVQPARLRGDFYSLFNNVNLSDPSRVLTKHVNAVQYGKPANVPNDSTKVAVFLPTLPMFPMIARRSPFLAYAANIPNDSTKVAVFLPAHYANGREFTYASSPKASYCTVGVRFDGLSPPPFTV